MRRLIAGLIPLVLAAAPAGIGPGAVAADDEAAKGVEAFAGDWVLLTIELQGASRPAAEYTATGKLTIRGTSIEREMDSFVARIHEKGTFAIVGSEPHQFKVDLDVTLRVVDDFGRRAPRKLVQEELWRLTDEGRLQMSVPGEPGVGRPEGFATGKSDKFLIYTYEKTAK